LLISPRNGLKILVAIQPLVAVLVVSSVKAQAIDDYGIVGNAIVERTGDDGITTIGSR
jgi:hypothetical protein